LARRLRKRWTVQCWSSACGQSASIALVRPRAPSATTHQRSRNAALDEPAPEFQPILLGLAHPKTDVDEHAPAVCVDAPGAQDALLGAGRADRKIDRIDKQRDELEARGVPLAEGTVVLAQLLAQLRRRRGRHRAHACHLAERLDIAHRSRIESPRTKAPTTIAFRGSLWSIRLDSRANSFEVNVSAARSCGVSI
jgi:hypothetical protein